MKRVLPALSLTLLALASPKIVFSAETENKHPSKERVDNYPRPAFETSALAMEALEKNINEIEAVLGKDSIEFVDLENIHEKTYALEAAVDKFRAEKFMADTLLNKIDESVQGLHYASETQDLNMTRDWFLKLKGDNDHISSNNTKLAETTNAPIEKKDFYVIIIKDHKFSPAELKVPANEKIKLVIDNQDSTPEEFESSDFNREKIIPGSSKSTIFVGPLKPGKYTYFGEFNPKSAQGTIIAE